MSEPTTRPVEGATGLAGAVHIFTADKGDYYDITDTVRQEAQEDE